MPKRLKKSKFNLLLIPSMLLALSVVWLCLYAFNRDNADEQGQQLMAARQYLPAAELFENAGDFEMAARCRQLYKQQLYTYARIDLQTGHYDRAREALAALGNYHDSLNLLAACNYLQAGELINQAEYLAAGKLLLGLDRNYPGREAALEKCLPALYEEGLKLAASGSYKEAGDTFSALEDYQDCPVLCERLLRMQQWLECGQRLITEQNKYTNGYYEQVYKCDEAYIVLPENPGENCCFLVYYPGGKDDEINTDFLLHYLMNPAPDTIAIFLRSNGLYNMEEKSLAGALLLEKAAAECAVFPTELVSCGSSLGAYPAMHSALNIPVQTGIKVSCVLSLDAGDDWKSPYVLSRSQCRDLARTDTEFYLFESPWVGTDRPAIKTMVDSGMDVRLVGCVYDEHVRITLDAMGMGVLHWAVGERTQACNMDIYSFRKLQ